MTEIAHQHLLITVAFSMLILVTEWPVYAAEYHVSAQGNDVNEGSKSQMVKTISAAALRAQPGDVIIVHEGIYRERINPPRSGAPGKRRIIYQAAPNEQVVIAGSEVVTNWVKVQNDTWKATIPACFFGAFNPYQDIIHGAWYDPKGRLHHTGAVYLNGHWLNEAAQLEEVLKPTGKTALWFSRVEKENTVIWAQFDKINPNEQLVEINVRQTVFYPEKKGINYITVRGFALRQAATPWAPPTAEQIGLIGTHWSKGWIIESNVISYSKCSGVALGKYGDEWDNTSPSAMGYVKTIERALKKGWKSETIGHHIVRDNTISSCEQAGIVGSLGAVFSTVSGNTIHDIHVQRLFTGAEMAAIKIHGAVDVEIRGNHIYRSSLGLWLDWMAQGTRVTGNLFNDNGRDLFLEVNHGPFLVDNNIFLSDNGIEVQSEGGAFVHNLIVGAITVRPEPGRKTPFLKAHTTEIVGLGDTKLGDVRFYNNLLVGSANLMQFDSATLSVRMGGNVFLNGAQPSIHEAVPLLKQDFNPQIKLVNQADNSLYLELTLDKA